MKAFSNRISGSPIYGDAEEFCFVLCWLFLGKAVVQDVALSRSFVQKLEVLMVNAQAFWW